METERAPARVTTQEIALGVVIFGSALALGSEHAVVLLIVALASTGVLFSTWWNAAPMSPRSAASTLLWVSIGLAAFTALQCIPLPMGLLGGLGPQNADVWMRALSPLRQDGPSFAPLSLDPNATHIEVLRGVTYVIVFLAAVRITAERRGAFVLSLVIVVTGLALGLAALLHPAFGTEKVFGIYRPEQPIPSRHIAPLLNPNTLAGYLNIAFALALAQAVAHRPQLPRYASAGAAFFLIVVQVWVASRAGLLCMGLAAIAVAALSAAARSHTNRGIRADVVGFGALAGVAVMTIALASSDDAWKELASTDTSKLGLFKNVLVTVKKFPVFGLGRGAFQSVFPADRVGTGFYVFTHPENVVLQWASEWGVPVAIAALAAIAWALRPRVALARGQVAVGAWAAIFAVAIHNLVDFSSETPGVVVALVVCAAIVTGGSSGQGRRVRWHAWGRGGRRVAVAGAVAAALAIALVLPGLGEDIYSERSALHEAAYAPTLSREGFHAAARAAMLRHPAEPYLPFMGAVRASRVHDESVIPWAARTLERAPVYGPVHILVARELRATRPAQARVEYRYALIDAPEYAFQVPAEAASLVKSADDAYEIAPPGKDGVATLTELARAVAPSRPATAWAIQDEILAREPNDVMTWTLRAQAFGRDIRKDDEASWCEEPAPCVKRALDAAAKVIALSPLACAGYALHARATAAAGDVSAALSEMAKAADETQDGSECLDARLDLARSYGTYEQTTAAIDDMVRRGCASAAECTARLEAAAAAEAQRDSLPRALAFERKAFETSPDCDSCLANVASYASRLGLHAEAMEAYAKLSKRHPDEPSYARSEANERNALLTPTPN